MPSNDTQYLLLFVYSASYLWLYNNVLKLLHVVCLLRLGGGAKDSLADLGSQNSTPETFFLDFVCLDWGKA